MLIRTPEGEFFGIDGSTQVPAGYPPERAGEVLSSGYAMAGIPGSVAALAKAVREHGTRPLSELVAPAIELAEKGFPLSARQAEGLGRRASVLNQYPASRQSFLKADGTPYQAGELFVMPADLARTLRALARDGAEAFYGGEVARLIAADMAANGGYVTMEDLASYEAKSSLVVRGEYRGYELVGTYAPAAGATTIEILHILENFELSQKSPAEWAVIVAQALRLGFQDQYKDLGSPEEAARIKVSKDWAAKRAREIVIEAPTSSGNGGRGSWFESEHTSHFSVADKDGGLVASTQTLGSGMGSKVVSPGVGFFYAATMGFGGVSASKPGERATSSMSPLIVVKDGKPSFVMGAAGGMRIISAIVQVLSRAIDQGLPFPQAMAAPRVHPDRGSLIEPAGAGDEIAMEFHEKTAWLPADVARVLSFGFMVITQRRSFANVHGIYFDSEKGEYIGVADPRGHGSAVGLPPEQKHDDPPPRSRGPEPLMGER